MRIVNQMTQPEDEGGNVDQDDWLAQRFEEHRTHLRSVAYRLLGSSGEADDAVQEAWIRLSRSDSDAVENLGGWLTTVVSRVSLDMLRARSSRREEPSGSYPPDHATGGVTAVTDPQEEAALADSVGAALLLVLDTLTPTERIAFVLHDTFAVPYDQIGPVLDRSPDAAKQLASRARQKVRGAATDAQGRSDNARQREVVDAFLAASRNGDFEALLSLLAPDIVLQADAVAVKMGSPERTLGASAVAHTFSGRALGAQPALIDGAMGIVWVVGGRPKVAWDFTISEGSITHMEMIADPDQLEALDLAVL